MSKSFHYSEATLTLGEEVCVKVQGQFVKAVYGGWSHDYRLPFVVYGGHKKIRRLYPMSNLGAEVEGSRGANALAEKHGLDKPKQDMNATRFDINTRFQFIEDLVNMVIAGESKSVIISGDGGLGKTYTVTACLKAAGLRDIKEVQMQKELEIENADWAAHTSADEETEDKDDSTVLEKEGDFEIIKGYSAPKALYRLLYENRNKIIIFDDCDSVWYDPIAVSMLKAALDSYDARWISWLSEMRGDDLPQSFLFKGRVVFVSNLRLKQLDQAVLSRCLYVDVSMTAEEKIERIKSIAPNVRKDMDKKQKAECVALLDEFKGTIGDLNIRTFLKLLEIRHTDKSHWKDLAEYVITAL